MSRKIYLTTALSMLLLAFGVVLLYWPGLGGPFILDDETNIIRAYVEFFDWDEIVYSVTHNTSGVLGRPVSMASLIFTGIVHGPFPWGFKYHNLLLHLINGLLIFWLLWRLLPHFQSRLSEEKRLLTAGLVVAFWLVHPLMVSTVLYPVQRMAQLSTFFSLSAALCYTMLRQNAQASGWVFYPLAYLLLPISMLLAVLSKENGALIPFYLFVIEFFVFQYRFNNKSERQRVLFVQVLFVALPLILGSLYFLTHLDQFINYELRRFTLGERLMTQLRLVLLFYPSLIFLPRLSEMTLFYDSTQAVQSFDLITVLLLGLLAFTVFMLFYLRKRAAVLAFGLAWYLVSHAMESTFIGLELIFEHRNYLGSAGLMFILIYYLVAYEKLPNLKFLCIPVLLLASFMTAARVQEWQTADTFYQLAVNDHPESIRAQAGMARHYYNSGNLNLAINHLQQAQEYNPDIIGLLLHQVLFFCETGVEVDELMLNAREMAEDHSIAVYELNTIEAILAKKRVSQCPELDLRQMLGLLEVIENHSTMRGNQLYLGYLARFKALSHVFLGDYQQGARFFEESYVLTDQPAVLIELLDIQLRLEQLDDAELLLSRLKAINDASFGIETARIEILEQRLKNQRAEQELNNPGQN